MADNLNPQEEDLLQSALSDAFSPAEVPRVSTQPPAVPGEPQAEAGAGASEADAPAAAAEEATPTLGSEQAEAWKADYEAHVTEWRARSAHQREKSEAERARWEAIRAQEESERKAAGLESSVASTSGWVKAEASQSAVSPSPADARDLVAGEAERKGHSAEPSSTFSSPPESSKQDKWEDIPSEMTSSYPSINFPSDTHSPSSSNQQHTGRHGHEVAHAHHAHHHREPPRATATSAVFDTTLSTRTRLLALASSLAINLLLPFINGVMLGAGELFAKNVVLRWFGWKNPGAPVANVGLRRQQRAKGP
ncbi:hypothetical protein EIP86_007160 [Pleurotus ostreatoroseus]|nr:hypothetical protein EIP86_007160 [Pleurotus ostreatoroseus]